MSKEIYISSTPHETRLAIVEKDELTEIYYERENEYTLAGSIYNGRVTRVLPGMQSSFVDIGLERDAFLYITDFMEEAGDAADFEAAGPEASGEAGSARNAGSRNGDRPQRGEHRGRRDGAEGRGRREDRGRDEHARDGQNHAGSETPVEDAREFVEPEDLDAAPVAGSTDEIGEGAPGANGSRRWRGRRGRRRGRSGHGEPAQAEMGAERPPAGESAGDADVEPQAAPEVRMDRTPREETRSGGGDREFAGDRGSGKSGSGNRERGDRDRRPEERRDRSAGREPRSESGRGAWRQEQAAGPDEGHGAAAEPLILPGESLSKYRRRDQEIAGSEGAGHESGSASATYNGQSTAPPLIKPKPSTEVEPLLDWDGGLVLPGETLSRHREPSREGRSDAGPRASSETEDGSSVRSFDGGRDRRRDRDARRGRDDRGKASASETHADQPAQASSPHSSSYQSSALDPAEAVQPAVSSQHEPEATDLPFREHAPEFETGMFEEPAAGATDGQEYEPASAADAFHEPQTDVAPPAAAAAPESLLDMVEEFHETVAEYEPGEDASASYRVDPVPASEFRQNVPADEFGDLAVVEPESSKAAAEEAAPAAAHTFTSVQSSGEMISETAPLNAEAGNPDVEDEFGTSPIEHETAVQSVHLTEAQASSVAFNPAQGSALSANFEPGDGQLEEELLDDDDEIGAMQTPALDDDTEEEILEMASGNSAPDLGSMIRDISIDEITRPEPVGLEDDDDDDFDIDEEDLEEDELQSTGEYDPESGDEISGSRISEVEEEEFAESDLQVDGWDDGQAEGLPADQRGVNAPAAGREDRSGRGREAGRPGERSGDRPGEREGRREGRRSGREHTREARGEHGGSGGQRDRRGMGSSRPNGGGRERGGRSMQATHLPAISDLLKPGQEVLVQIAKEPMAKKGARITSHIALPGRFLVFMPTVSHVGVSRKIESDGERRRLKEILLSERGEASGGFIVRTAASGASEEELRSDLRFLLNLWADIKQRSESSKSPALIYHDLNLVERILRDQVTDNFSAIWVDTETEYERVLRFLQRFQPSLIRRVKLYTKDTPLFEQFGISAEIDKALRSKVWLKSGGSIVINQTEALVAIDINTGKFVGKTARLEDTIVKTNLDAIPEIVRQIRLRDLGGIIIIDFIDMDERKNRSKVMAALEEELKKDRAPSKVLQFNDFGLVAITRKRVKQSLERTLSTTCAICQGTGMTKSPVTVCNDIYIEMRKMHKIIEKPDIMLRVNPEVVKQLKSGSGKWLQEMEEMSGKTILVKSDPSLHPEQFDIH